MSNSGQILVPAFYKDVSNAVTNLNDLIATGKYRFGPNATGSPDSSSYGIVVIFSTDDVESTNNIWVFQTAYLTGGKIFLRRKINTNAWTDWMQIGNTKNLYTFFSSVAMSATLSYTGKSITVPANHAFSVTVNAQYNASKPDIVAVSTSSTASSAIIASALYGATCASVTYSGATSSSDETYYIWTKYASAGNSNLMVTGYATPI